MSGCFCHRLVHSQRPQRPCLFGCFLHKQGRQHLSNLRDVGDVGCKGAELASFACDFGSELRLVVRQARRVTYSRAADVGGIEVWQRRQGIACPLLVRPGDGAPPPAEGAKPIPRRRMRANRRGGPCLPSP